MPIVPTNQSKSVITPTGARKNGIYLWGDTQATWGDAQATWGGTITLPTNQSKSPTGTTTITPGMTIGLLVALTYSSTITIGTGVTNQNKS